MPGGRVGLRRRWLTWLVLNSGSQQRRSRVWPGVVTVPFHSVTGTEKQDLNAVEPFENLAIYGEQHWLWPSPWASSTTVASGSKDDQGFHYREDSKCVPGTEYCPTLGTIQGFSGKGFCIIFADLRYLR